MPGAGRAAVYTSYVTVSTERRAKASRAASAQKSRNRGRSAASRAIAVFRHAVRATDFGAIMRRSAAVAYYAALSLAPLLIVALAIAGLAWDREAVRSSIVAEMRGLLGAEGATLIDRVFEHARDPAQGPIAAIIGVLTLLFGATAVFVELQDGLNAIWQVERPTGSGVWKFVRTRLLSLSMVFSIGFMLLVSLLVSTALSALLQSLALENLAIVGLVLHFLVSLLVTGALFAALFKFLPDARIAWRDVIVGAATTAVLFNLGQIAIGQYLGRASVGSAYGAAGSLVIVLVWVYYSAAIVFFGAELTESHATLLGHGLDRSKGGPVSPR
jgi:membrane protein